jgi:polyisoprenoid-binding protein YceI
MIKNFSWVLFLVMASQAFAQKYVSERGVITFFSEAAIENISATNTKATSMLNTSTADIAFSISIRDFQFEKKLMQQHFNEKYMESDKFPKATFYGKLIGFDASKSEIQSVHAKGKLTIHGVTNEIDVSGTVHLSENLLVKSKFVVKLADYKVKIPQLMWQNIAEQVEVTVEFTYKPQ